MRRPLLLLISSLLMFEVLPASGQAQLIDVGPGYVRAPFVRVHRRGRARARVRAPFVDVEGGGAPYRQPPAAAQPPVINPPPVPAASTPDPARTMVSTPAQTPDWQGLRKSIVAGEAQLQQQLSATRAGETYRKRLRVGRLRELVLENATTPPTGETRRQLQEILEIYNQTLIDPNQRWVSRLSGFETVQAGLMQLLAPAETAVPRPENVSIERTPSPLLPPPIPAGEPQPTQVLPPVRETR